MPSLDDALSVALLESLFYIFVCRNFSRAFHFHLADVLWVALYNIPQDHYVAIFS